MSRKILSIEFNFFPIYGDSAQQFQWLVILGVQKLQFLSEYISCHSDFFLTFFSTVAGSALPIPIL